MAVFQDYDMGNGLWLILFPGDENLFWQQELSNITCTLCQAKMDPIFIVVEYHAEIHKHNGEDLIYGCSGCQITFPAVHYFRNWLHIKALFGFASRHFSIPGLRG